MLPSYEQDPSYYSDWGDPREYTIDDMGVGECAGEVVPFVEVGLAGSEREIFEAQVLLDDGNDQGRRVARLQRDAARRRARSRARRTRTSSAEPDEVVGEFRKHFYDTQLFFDPYAGGKFAQYLFRAHEEHGKRVDRRERRTS